MRLTPTHKFISTTCHATCPLSRHQSRATSATPPWQLRLQPSFPRDTGHRQRRETLRPRGAGAGAGRGAEGVLSIHMCGGSCHHPCNCSTATDQRLPECGDPQTGCDITAYVWGMADGALLLADILHDYNFLQEEDRHKVVDRRRVSSCPSL